MSRSAAKSRADKSRPVAAPPPPSVPPATTVDIVPGRLTETDWLEMVAREEGEEVVALVLGQLLEDVLDRCYDVYLQRQQVPFTVWWVREVLIQTVKWRFVVRDEGDDPNSALLWTENPEPQASIIDSWAEGCIPVVYAKQQEHTPLLQKLLDLSLEESKDSINPDKPSRGSSQCGEGTPPSAFQAPPSSLRPPAEPHLQSANPNRKYQDLPTPSTSQHRNNGNTRKPLKSQRSTKSTLSSQKPL
ncbi:uncharacterized protein C2orf81 homolog [Brachyhypopomus gauderio]|uniref:uncharacterized protein C2orf81 homolog n=1 Tax=Brachyhypopomus gauderio TaxID=698409 RepID=UPI0040429154